MTNKEAAWHLGTYSTTMGSGQTTDEQHNEAKRMAIKALSQEPCDDAISRDAVCDYIAEFVNNEYSTQSECEMVDFMIEGIQHLPSVTQKSGKWIDYSDEGYVECPFCGHATTCEDNIDELHYCFYCGAKMVEPQESEDKG